MIEFLCALPILGVLLSDCLPPPPLATGYVEGEYVLVAPVEIAQIAAVPVRRGDHVAAGQVLAQLERRDAEIAVAQAQAALARAQSQLANLKRGRRKAEIAVIEASLAQARAQEAEARRELERERDLLHKGVVTEAKFDVTRTRYEVAQAKVAELEANLRVAHLPAREDEIRAAEAGIEEARTALDRATWRLSKRELTATVPAQVIDVIRQEGEIAGPAAPVLSLLPDGAVKLRLFIPERDLSKIRLGSRLVVDCDACPPGMTAAVTYISDGPEFTPPVIYSLENRQKLVFLIEARPAPGTPPLLPGQIVSVDLAPAGTAPPPAPPPAAVAPAAAPTAAPASEDGPKAVAE